MATTLKSIAITGATGFVGSALAHALAAEGHKIRVLARSSSDRSRLSGLDLEWAEGDVTLPHTLRGAFDDVDWVIHAAGMLGQWGVPESAYQELNCGGTLHVLSELATGTSRPRVLYVSSPGVLGPITGEAADEGAAIAPSNPYERSKANAEQIALQFFGEGLPIVIARPEFIYGPGDYHVLELFRAIQKGMFFYIGDGRHTCHPTFIEDAVDGLIRCLKRGQPGETYHVTGPRPVTFRELATTMAAAMGCRAPRIHIPRSLAWTLATALELAGRVTGVRPPLTRTGVAFFSESRRFSWQKAHQTVDYMPRFDLKAGMRQTVDWYRDRGLLERRLVETHGCVG